MKKTKNENELRIIFWRNNWNWKKIEECNFKNVETCKIITKESNANDFFCKITYYQKEIKVLFINNNILNEIIFILFIN